MHTPALVISLEVAVLRFTLPMLENSNASTCRINDDEEA